MIDWATAKSPLGDAPNGWRELLPALQLVEIPSSHVDVVSEQASPLAASALRQALASARERVGRPGVAESTPPTRASDSADPFRVA